MSDKAQKPEKQHLADSVEARIHHLQHCDNIIRRRAQSFDNQRFLRLHNSDKPLHQQTDQIVEEKKQFQRIDNWLKEQKAGLDKLPSPKITCSLSRPLTQNEKDIIKTIDAAFGKMKPTSRTELIENECVKVNESTNDESDKRQALNKLDALKAKCDTIDKTYREISKPIREQLEEMRRKRDVIDRKLAYLHDLERQLLDIHSNTKINSTRKDQKKLLNTVRAFIKKARNHRVILSKEIKKGHCYLFRKSRQLKVDIHPYFLPEQMGEYKMQGGRVHLSHTSCDSDCTAMLISDINSNYANETGARKVYKMYISHYIVPGGAALFNPEGARVLNKLQDAATYRYKQNMTKKDVRQALTWSYRGQKLGIIVRIKDPLDTIYPSSTTYGNHSLVIDDMKRMGGVDYVFIRDPYYPNLSYSVRWDDLAEIWTADGTIPIRLRKPTNSTSP